MGAAFCAFDWDKERITLDDSAKLFLEEFDRIDYLKAQAEFAKSGKTPNNGNDENQNTNTTEKLRGDSESWEFYVQRNNMVTWRREEEEGHYAYKGNETNKI